MAAESKKFAVSLADEAISQAIKMRNENPHWHDLALRLYLEGKGCDGFYYGVSFAEMAPDDICFEFFQKSQKISLVVDPDTIDFVDGSHIEWVDDERGSGFLVENPNHRKFRGKFYKRKVWQERLIEKKTNKISDIG